MHAAMSEKWNILQPSEWHELRDLYKEQRQYANSYHLIQFFIDCHNKNATADSKIYTVSTNWRKDGSFIALWHLQGQTDFTHVFGNTLSDELSILSNAFSALNEQQTYLFQSFPERIVPAVRQYIEHCGLQNVAIDATKWYHLKAELVEQLKIDIPENIVIAPVDLVHAEYINSVWPHRSDSSIHFIKHIIEYNISTAAYDRDGKLLAWCLQQPSGFLGTLQVEEAYKRRGLGSLVVSCMAKQLHELGCAVMAPVVPTNKASCAMFEKLGFKVIDQVFWALRRSL